MGVTDVRWVFFNNFAKICAGCSFFLLILVFFRICLCFFVSQFSHETRLSYPLPLVQVFMRSFADNQQSIDTFEQRDAEYEALATLLRDLVQQTRRDVMVPIPQLSTGVPLPHV